ncbi:hypothetical protein [Nesterenkonia sp. HG001]|uniref:hypothetical protein n=1 Tax=Nesterenkonia sp. HG001 TaxID=2983207 RepID=UPI002AC6ECBC|nr:hypothetical protein [Nesterenkonia sp. HG001]MDZ5076926.1 hypothetical protein [Nesterenkonia sp. HG001]
MAEAWREARLIPTSGIRGTTEQEVRATSALLAVLSIVPSFAHALLKPCGASLGRMRANVECFVEVAFEDKKKKRSPRPDGLIRVTRGSTVWTALVEVKTEGNGLDQEQVESYMDVAKEHGFDAVLTISNEIPPIQGTHPLSLDGRSLRAIPVFHYSWVRIITLAIMEREVRGIEDDEQKWILGELIRYLEHENSGALDFTDMGTSWKAVTECVKTGLVRRGASDVLEVATRFDGLIRYISFKLGQRLGVDVTPQLPRKQRENPAERAAQLASELEKDGSFSGSIRIPGTVSDMDIRCDMRAKQIQISTTVPASGHARNATRINWLLRPLDDDLTDVVVEAHAGRRHHAESLEALREDVKDALPEGFPEIRSFTITRVSHLGLQGTTRGKESFINSVIQAVDDFYANILQRQRVWTPPAPEYRSRASEPGQEEVYSSEELASPPAEVDHSEEGVTAHDS